MARFAVFLRGINVGGRRVKADGLTAPLVELGFEGVTTFRASGNVILSAPKATVGELSERIEKALEDALGFEIVAFVRPAARVLAIAGHRPFPAKAVEASGGKLQVLLLPRKPRKRAADEVLGLASRDDRVALDGAELYWLPSGGTMESALDLKAIEKAIGPTTMRTKGTLEQIASKYFEAGS